MENMMVLLTVALLENATVVHLGFSLESQKAGC